MDPYVPPLVSVCLPLRLRQKKIVHNRLWKDLLASRSFFFKCWFVSGWLMGLVLACMYKQHGSLTNCRCIFMRHSAFAGQYLVAIWHAIINWFVASSESDICKQMFLKVHGQISQFNAKYRHSTSLQKMWTYLFNYLLDSLQLLPVLVIFRWYLLWVKYFHLV